MKASAHLQPAETRRYLRKRGISGPWRLEGLDKNGFDGVVVIPALAESRHLPATLKSLARNPPELLQRFPVVIVVNNTCRADNADKEDNLRTLAGLLSNRLTSGIPRLAWIDAASPGLEIPTGEGVGTARKLGFDLALSLCPEGGNPLLVSLDADTQVEPSYLAAILAHFKNHVRGCAVLPYSHQPGETAAMDTAIACYELYLRANVLGLEIAGSPYAFHTIGSTMACRAAAYVRAGGMNRRSAGEDFYFLQHMQKTTGVAHVRGTRVYPSSRPSLRVPFGTGPTLARFLDAPDETVRFYPPEGFFLLKEWLCCTQRLYREPALKVLEAARAISPFLGDFLEAMGFIHNWQRLQANHSQREHFLNAFHGWFDALRSRQFFHALATGPLSYCDRDQGLEPLFAARGLTFPVSLHDQLTVLRHDQS